MEDGHEEILLAGAHKGGGYGKSIKGGTKMKRRAVIAMLLLVLTAMAGASWATEKDTPGAVYTMTNDPSGNEVVIFGRNAKGILTKMDSVSTKGAGSGGGLDPLGSQGSLVLSHDHQWLLAVNAGSNEISVFQVVRDGLDWVDKVSSGGTRPVSLAVFHNLVYVLNVGGSPNITGFDMSHRGELKPLAQSTRSLGPGSFAQVGFDPHGNNLIVTDKADSEILVYSVDHHGLPAKQAVTSASNGITPFGFIFDPWGNLLVVEAGSAAVSSYEILSNDTLNVIRPSVANGQIASCWIARNERYAFTANAGSHTISAYGLKAGKKSLVLLKGNAGIGTLDLATSTNGRFLYVLNPGDGTVGMFRIKPDGSLVDLGAVQGGLPAFAQGLAAR